MKLSSEDKASMSTKYDKIRKQVKLLGRIDVEIHEASRDRKDLYAKWQDFLKSALFKKSQPYEKTLLGLDFAVREVGNNNAIDELIGSTIQTTHLFINRFSYSDYNLIVTALKWFKTPQQALKGDVPWRIMHTEYGRSRVRKAMTAEFGSHIMQVLQETVTGLHKIGFISTKDKDEILKGAVKLGIRPLKESFDNFVHTAEAIQRGEKVKVQKGIYFENEKALRKVLGENTNLSKKDIAALAALAAAGQIILPTKKGKLKPFKGVENKGEPLSKIIIENRR